MRSVRLKDCMTIDGCVHNAAEGIDLLVKKCVSFMRHSVRLKWLSMIDGCVHDAAENADLLELARAQPEWDPQMHVTQDSVEKFLVEALGMKVPVLSLSPSPPLYTWWLFQRFLAFFHQTI